MFSFATRLRGATTLFRYSSTQSNNDFRTRLMTEIKVAMKAKDSMAATTYRSALSEINNVDKSARQPLTSSGMIGVVRKAIQRRGEAAVHFREAKRADLAEKEEKEAALLSSILPPLLTNDEIDEHLKAVLASLPADSDRQKSMRVIFKEFYLRVDQANVVGDVVKKRLEALIGE